MKYVRQPSIRELQLIGCEIGQEVKYQIHSSKKGDIFHVYDAKTEKLIGKIKL